MDIHGNGAEPAKIGEVLGLAHSFANADFERTLSAKALRWSPDQ